MGINMEVGIIASVMLPPEVKKRESTAGTSPGSAASATQKEYLSCKSF